MSCDRKPQGHRPPDPQAGVENDDLHPVPSAEAMLAGTLALMTGVVERAALTQPLAGHAQSLMMAAKVRSNLFFLSGHPQLSSGFRMTIERLRTHWDRLTVPASGEAVADLSSPDAPQRLWHRAPDQLQ